MAARTNAEVHTSPLGSELLVLKCRELARAAGDNAERIADFQHRTLDSLDIRGAINSGQRGLDDLMGLLDRARKFRHWLDGKPIETDLVTSYITEATAETWAFSLPAKLVRLATIIGVGIWIDGTAGLAAGAALSAGDIFLLERIVSGWRPNQFVVRELDPFVRK